MTEATEPNQAPTESEVIRYPSLFSDWPIHTLSPERDDAIQIAELNDGADEKTARKTAPSASKRKDNQSLVHFNYYWEVSGNKKHGDAGPGTYRIDTLVIYKRADELRTLTGNVPELMFVGSLADIARAIGKKPGDTSTIKRDLLRGASTFIDFRIPIKFGSTTEVVEGHSARYGVYFRGEALKDGTKAEGVYIEWMPRFRRILQESTVRPHDYDLQQELTPLDSRFYEILNPDLYWSWREGRQHTPVRYSDFCDKTWIERKSDLRGVRKQITRHTKALQQRKWMRPTIDFEKTADRNGDRDWFMRFEIGDEAKRWFERRMRGSSRKAPSTAVSFETATKTPRKPKKRSQSLSEPNTGATELVSRFYKARFDIETYEPTPKEAAIAAQLIERAGGDLDKAGQAIELAAELGRKNGEEDGFPSVIGGVLKGSYLQVVERSYEKEREQANRLLQEQQDDADAAAYNQAMRERAKRLVEALSPAERDAIVDTKFKEYIKPYRSYVDRRGWNTDQARKWAAPKILDRWARREQPRYGEWLKGRSDV